MMMMNQKPRVDVPPWSLFEDSPSPYPLSPGILNDATLAALQRYLPSNDIYNDEEDDDSDSSPIDAYSCDEFRMYEFKVRRCARGRSHDWTECPYAHPGEKARRRDPRKYHYSGTACPDFRKGNCKRGDTCEFAHGVFECWLHPARYRTQPCKDGTACRRRVCFFAHTPDQLRVLPQSTTKPASSPDSYDGSPMRQQLVFSSSSPTSTLISPPMSPTGESPPMSPDGLRRPSWPVNEVLASLRKLQLGKVKSCSGSGFGLGFASPRVVGGGFYSLPSTPTKVVNGLGGFSGIEGEEHVERVESGRALRAKMYERLSKGSGMERTQEVVGAGVGPDVGWVFELVK